MKRVATKENTKRLTAIIQLITFIFQRYNL